MVRFVYVCCCLCNFTISSFLFVVTHSYLASLWFKTRSHIHREIESLPLNCNSSAHPLPVTDNNRKWLTRSLTAIPSGGNAVVPDGWFQLNHRTLLQEIFCPQTAGYRIWTAGKGEVSLLAPCHPSTKTWWGVSGLVGVRDSSILMCFPQFAVQMLFFLATLHFIFTQFHTLTQQHFYTQYVYIHIVLRFLSALP